MSERTADLEAAQNLVDELHHVGPADLTEEEADEIRKSLPTDPTLARIVKLSLPPPWDEVFVYVPESENGHQPAYWRTKTDQSTPRSEAEQRRNERMRAAAERMRGTRGTVGHDGKEIPASAAIVAEEMAGRRFPGARAVQSGRKVLRRLREQLRA